MATAPGTTGPAAEVAARFTDARKYAEDATTTLRTFTKALAGSDFDPPRVDFTWAVPGEFTPAEVDTFTEVVIDPVDVSGDPGSRTFTPVNVTIDSFDDRAPSLNLPSAPTLNYGRAPTIPDVGTVAVPDAPTLAEVAVPRYLSLNTPTFAGVDLHYDFLSKLEDIPTLDLVAPTPYSYARGPAYASELLASLKATLSARMKGGTGLAPAIEQAIWDRARSRETQTALANEAEVMRNSEALGFQLPSGVLAAQLREAQQAYYDKLSGLSRDVAVKQADLEQENLKQTIASGMQLEGQLIDYSYKLEQMTFEAAKTVAENALQIYNGKVESFKALLSAYNTYATAYKTIMDAELSKVEVYKAELQGEQTKAEVNNSLVQQYKAQIESGLSRVEVYKAQVGAANTLVQLEQAKISAAGEQIKAYVAQVNAETAKVEAYKVNVQAETSKLEVYRANVQAYSARTGAQAEKARAEISRYSAEVQAYGMQWDGYKARVAARGARAQYQAASATAKADAYSAKARANEAENTANARKWEAEIQQYIASQNLAVQAAKMNGDFAVQANNARNDAAKVGAQVYAQLTASSYGMASATATISDSGIVSYNYNDMTI